MNVLIVDDHPLVVDALSLFLRKEFSYFKIQTAPSLQVAENIFNSDHPIDLLFCDLNFNGQISGIRFIKTCKDNFPRAKVVVFSMHSESAIFNSCLKQGADAYVLKTDSPTEIGQAVRHVLAGKNYLSSSISQTVNLNRVSDTLTKREIEIAKLVAKGMTSKQIASQLDISQRTVEVHRQSLMSKLRVENLIELSRLLSDEGLT